MENFNKLHYFVTLAKFGSFVKAAQNLDISASALSHSIKSLETRLNMRLFNRTTRSVSLTEVGEKLLADIAPHFQAI